MDTNKAEPTLQDLLFGEIAIRLNFITRKQLEECIELQKKKHFLLGQILKEKGYLSAFQIEKVLHQQKKLIALREQCALAQMGTADVLRKMNKIDEAIEEYNYLIDHYPDQPELVTEAKNKMAEIHISLGDYKKALSTYKEVTTRRKRKK